LNVVKLPYILLVRKLNYYYYHVVVELTRTTYANQFESSVIPKFFHYMGFQMFHHISMFCPISKYLNLTIIQLCHFLLLFVG